MAKKTKKRTLPKVSTLDVVRLGQRTAELKANTKPKDWAKIVKAAHAGGYTVNGALSGNPDPLKERLQSSLKVQAQREVDTAYKPAYADNDQQQSRVKAWEAKRTIDNRAYEQWVAEQTAKLDDQARTADKTIRDAAHAASLTTGPAWAANQAGAQANAASAQGNVSNPGQSKALDMAVPAAAAQAAAANAEQRANDVTGVFAQTRPLLAAGAAAQQAALSAAATADTQKMMRGLLDDRSKLTLAKAGDFMKTWTGLQDKEVSKASSNRDYQTVVEQLNQAGAKIETTAATEAAKIESREAESAKDRSTRLAIAKVNATAKADTLAETTRHNQAMEAAQTSGARLAETKRHNREMERISEAKGAGRSKPGGRDTTTRKADGKIVSDVGRAKVRFASLRARRKAGSKLDIIQVMTKDGYDLPTIQIARALLDHNGKLPAQTKRIAKALGISDPSLLEG